MIIDFHTHAFPADVAANRGKYFDDKNFAALYSSPKARLIDGSALLEAMDASKIAVAVVMGFPWLSEKLCRSQNEYFAALQNRAAGRLFCFGSAPLYAGKAALKSTVREISAFNLAGIGEAAFYGGFDYKSEKSLDALLEAAFELPVCIHVNEPVGRTYAGKYEPRFASLYKVISRHNAATIILAHWGGGLFIYELMQEVKEAFRNVYYDSAASPYLYDESIFAHAASIAGAGKILFGSDHPLLPFDRCLEQAERAIKDKKEHGAICGGNAARLLKIDGNCTDIPRLRL
ncbi:MAG: amidohydrolase family protein [Leptospirales bacterium]|nr:amidohydrolase family protein [Leptospirales bacterium]